MGEHTDYNGGFVLPFALTQGVTATASARDDGLLELRSAQVPGEPVTVALDGLAPGGASWLGTGSAAGPPTRRAWPGRCARPGYPVGGATVEVDSDLPVGAGVSSSAALECAVALALCSLSGFSVPRRELAAIARRAENEFVGAPTGIIDQSAALLCTADHALLLDCDTLQTTQVPFRPAAAGAAALVIDTRVTHALVSGEYAARRAECEQAARLLGTPALGTVTDLHRLTRLADPVLHRRARHVITDSARARAVADALAARGPGRGDPSRRNAGRRDERRARSLHPDRQAAGRGAHLAAGRLRGVLARRRRDRRERHRGGRLRGEDDRRRVRRLGARPGAGGAAERGPGGRHRARSPPAAGPSRTSSTRSRPRRPAGSATRRYR